MRAAITTCFLSLFQSRGKAKQMKTMPKINSTIGSESLFLDCFRKSYSELASANSFLSKLSRVGESEIMHKEVCMKRAKPKNMIILSFIFL